MTLGAGEGQRNYSNLAPNLANDPEANLEGHDRHRNSGNRREQRGGVVGDIGDVCAISRLSVLQQRKAHGDHGEESKTNLAKEGISHFLLNSQDVCCIDGVTQCNSEYPMRLSVHYL